MLPTFQTILSLDTVNDLDGEADPAQLTESDDE